MTTSFVSIVASSENTSPSNDSSTIKKFATSTNNTITVSDATRRPNPAKAAYDKKMTDIENQIKVLQSRIEKLKLDDQEGSAGMSKEIKALRSSLISKKKDLFNKRDALEKDKNQLAEELKALDETSKKQNEQAKVTREKLPYKDIKQIDSLIKEKEKLIEGGLTQLKEEKNILQDISKLRKSRKQLESLESDDAVQQNSKAMATLNYQRKKAQLDEKFKSLKEVRESMQNVKDQLDATEINKEEVASRKKRTEDEIKSTKAEIDNLYKAKREAFDSYTKDKQERQEAYIRKQARREEQKKREDLEDKINQVYKKLRAIDPSGRADKKLNECVNLANYFGQFIQVHGDVAKISTHEPVAKPVYEDYDIVKPKSTRNDIYFKSSPKPTTMKKTHAPSDTLPKLPLHILAGLADLGYQVPKTITDSKELLVQLGRRREEIEEERKKALEAVADKQKELETEIAALNEQLAALPPSFKKAYNEENEEN